MAFGRGRRRDVPPAVRAGIDDEIGDHLRRRTADLVRKGLDDDAARRQALDEFGDLDMARRALQAIDARIEHRATAGLGWRRLMSNLTGDLRQALRTMRTQPWLTAAIVMTLAVGIGASTAVYAVFNYAIFRPVPGVADADRLVGISVRPELGAAAYTTATHEHLTAMREMPAFTGLAGHSARSYPVRLGASDPETLQVATVSQGYFDLLGVQLAAGRLFTSDEYEAPGTTLAVISERLWRAAFGTDPGAVGGWIHVLGHPFTVIGVARSFRGLERVGEEDVWVPIGAQTILLPSRGADYRWDRMVARLAPNVLLATAREQAASAFARVGVREYGDRTFTAVVSPDLTISATRVGERVTPLFWLAMAGSALLLVLACANGAGLLLSRNLRRRRDLALKAAIGASRLRLARELLVEASAISALAAGTGLIGAYTLTGWFRTQRLLGYLPLDGLEFDWRVAFFAAAAAAATAALAGGLPSLLAARAGAQADLGHAARTTSRSGRLRQGLVSLQVALSLALVAGAGVLSVSIARLQSVDLGFEPAGLFTFELQPTLVGRDDAAALLADVRRRLSATPGIEAVGVATGRYLGGAYVREARRSAGAPSERVMLRLVSDGFLEAMGIPLLSGRDLTAAEAAGPWEASPVIVNEMLARRTFGDASPIGRTLQVRRPDELSTHRIIGVAGSTVALDLRDGHQPAVFGAAGEPRAATFQVRSSLGPAGTISAIRGIVRELEPRLAVDSIRTTGAEVERLTSEERVLARLGVVLAVLALGLAAAGIYAAIACAVQERTRELGIRMALGASRPAIGRDVLLRTAVVVAVGLAGGLALYAWASQFLSSQIFGLSALDPVVIAAACGMLLATALAAAWLPTQRATRVDPTVALRAE
jgi:predicted permease